MRSHRIFFALSAVACGLLVAGFRNAPFLSAEEIMLKVKETHGADAEQDLIKMVTLSDNGKAETREFFSAVQRDAKGNMRYFLRFLSPEDEKGVALLVVDKDNGDSDQYLYLPSVGQARKIEGSGRAGYFMGSDFTFEDLRKEKPDEWTYARQLDEKVDGTDCYVILSSPKDKQREQITGYTNREVYVDKATYDIRRIEFFDSKNKLIKVFNASEYKPTDGPSPTQRPRRAVMNNNSKNTTTTMVLVNSKLNQPLDDSFFSLDTIKNWGPAQDKIIKDLETQAAPAAPAKKP